MDHIFLFWFFLSHNINIMLKTCWNKLYPTTVFPLYTIFEESSDFCCFKQDFLIFFTKQDVFYLKLAFQTRCWYFFNYVRIQVNLCIFMFLKILIYLFTVHNFFSFFTQVNLYIQTCFSYISFHRYISF